MFGITFKKTQTQEIAPAINWGRPEGKLEVELADIASEVDCIEVWRDSESDYLALIINGEIYYLVDATNYYGLGIYSQPTWADQNVLIEPDGYTSLVSGSDFCLALETWLLLNDPDFNRGA